MSGGGAGGRSGFDAIVVGGGHNGLTAAAYLARAGRRVLVVERNRDPGGAAATDEPIPGYRFSTCPSIAPPPRRILRDLRLRRHGLELLPLAPSVWSPDPEGGEGLLLPDSAGRARDAIAGFSGSDAGRWAAFLAQIRRWERPLRPWLFRHPPALAPSGARDGWETLRLALRLRRLGRRQLEELLRVLPMSVADFLADWFETDRLRALIAGGTLLGSMAGPFSPGTAALLLHDGLTTGNGLPGPRVTPRGGAGALGAALASAARAFGAEVRCGTEAEAIRVRGETACGVVLAGGEEVEGRVVLSGVDPRRTFLDLVGPARLDPEFALRIRHLQMRGALGAVHLALEGLPGFTIPADRDPARVLAGRIRIAPGLVYLERAFDEAKHGVPSAAPFLEAVIPSLTDPSLAPAEGHTLTALVQYAPFRLRDGDWNGHRDRLGDTVVERLARHAPDLPGRIRGRVVLTPADLESRFGLTGGHIYHGEHCLDQLFFLRPLPECARYRTPVRNLYLCGAGTPPGGGVAGLCGRNAALQVLRDWKSGRLV